MNNILSDAVIESINNYNTDQILTLFKDVLEDNSFKKRVQERLGVNNRFKLEPSNTYVLGRDAEGVPVYIRPESKNVIDADLLQNIKIHKDYPNIIASNKSGYLSGYVVESKTDNTDTVEEFNEFEDENHFTAVFNDLVRKCTGYGKKAIRLYLENGISKTAELEPWNYAPFYSKTGALVGVMQWTEITQEVNDQNGEEKYRVSYVNESEDLYFIADMTEGTISLDSQHYPATVVDTFNIPAGTRPHGYSSVPVVEFKNNTDELGDIEKTLDSQDARDELLSKSSTTWGAFADVLLRDKTLDQEDVNINEFQKLLRDYGLMQGDIEFVSRDYKAYQDLQRHYNQLETDIYEGSNSYNPNSLGGDGGSPTAYQIRQKMKLLIDSTVDTENQFYKSFRQLFKLVLTAGFPPSDSMEWKDLTVRFLHTVPEDKMVTLEQMVKAGTVPSNKMVVETAGYNYEVWLSDNEEQQGEEPVIVEE